MKNNYFSDHEAAQIITEVCSSASACLNPLAGFEKQMWAETLLVDSLSAQQDKHFKQRRNLSTKATPAMKLLCAIGDWTGNAKGTPISERAHNQAAYGYKVFGKTFEGEERVCMVLRASEFDAVELQTLISYPDRKGNGSAVMRKLCDVADEFRVTLWLDAFPYGKDRQHIPLSKLKDFYFGFGFTQSSQINLDWLCGFHKIYHPQFHSPMIRMPRGNTPMTAIESHP